MRFLASFCFLLLTAFAWTGTLAADASQSDSGPTMLSPSLTPAALGQVKVSAFEKILEQAVHEDDFVGLAVAVVCGGETVFLKTYGVKEFGAADPVTPQTLFRLASVSKGFASALAGIAVDENKIQWSTPIAPYEPLFALPGGGQSTVTVEEILSHRVGLPPNAYDNLLEAGVSVADILPRFRSVRPICKIGACYAYQNIAYNMIGDILSTEYGAPYEDLVAARIFGPLGMTWASFGRDGLISTDDWARPQIRDRLPGAKKTYTEWRTASVDGSYYRVPAAGGVNANILDMAAWLKAQMGYAPNVLPRRVLDKVHQPLIETGAETRRMAELSSRIDKTAYGLGWRVYDYAGHKLINHSGGVKGYAAQIAFLPDRDVGIVILANTRAKRVYRILPTFLDIELDLPKEDWLMLRSDGAAENASQTGDHPL